MFIYKIINNITQDFYIGKTKKSIIDRFKKHLYLAKKNKKTHLYNAIRKYGASNFNIILLESTTKKKLNTKEIEWIAKLKPRYNMTRGGDGGVTKILSKKEKQILSKKYSGKGNPMWGKFGKNNPNYGQKRGTNIKISNALKNPCICNNKKFKSIGEAEQYFKIKKIPVSVRKRLDSKKYPTWYRLIPKTNRC